MTKAAVEEAIAGYIDPYLETDLAVNVPFYERQGFAVAQELEILGARVWRMRRPSRAFSPDGCGY